MGMDVTSPQPSSPAPKRDLLPERLEAKYIVPDSLLPDLREFLKPFCEPDAYGEGDPPCYTVTTLQLDTFDFALHRAKEDEALNRFKLRVRTYGEPGTNPVFPEVKRRIGNTIVKSRSRVPFELWSERLLFEPLLSVTFRSHREENDFLEFRRLVQEIGALPVVLLRYERESYFGSVEQYARISFDRRLVYQPTHSWTGWGRNRRWIPMDSSSALPQGLPFSGVIMEIKTLNEMPQWMAELVSVFGLERAGNCKYSNALWRESLFCGSPSMPDFVASELAW
jgi:hypothetical protein